MSGSDESRVKMSGPEPTRPVQGRYGPRGLGGHPEVNIMSGGTRVRTRPLLLVPCSRRRRRAG